MSTKNLAKTAIEGGRHNGNKFDRRESHRHVRAKMKDYLKKVIHDPSYSEEEFEPELTPVYKEFTDKLSPMYRWIDAQVGRPWDEVRSEVFQKFDTKTTAGRHITFDHLLYSVVETNSGWDNRGNNLWDEASASRMHYYRRPDYYVNEDGILCKTERDKRPKWSTYPPEEELDKIAAWLNGGMIGYVGDKLHWYAPTEGCWRASWQAKDVGHYHYYRVKSLQYQLWEKGEIKSYEWNTTFKYWMDFKQHGWGWIEVKNPFSFRLRGALTPEEVKYFKSLDSRVQDEILAFTKGR